VTFRDYSNIIDGWVTPFQLRYLYTTAMLDRDLPGGLLEVGCYQGLSTSALMQVDDGSLTVVDTFGMAIPDGTPQRERFEKNVTMVMNDCNLEHFVNVHEMRSDEFFAHHASWYHPRFRLAFIDGDHSYLGQSADLRSAAQQLCPGGTLIFDDHCFPEVAAAANDNIPGWMSVDGKFGVWRKPAGYP
jgi:predicted O-methyltransferase YrrM